MSDEKLKHIIAGCGGMPGTETGGCAAPYSGTCHSGCIGGSGLDGTLFYGTCTVIDYYGTDVCACVQN